MNFPPFMMGYHKRAKSPIHAEPKHEDCNEDLKKKVCDYIESQIAA